MHSTVFHHLSRFSPLLHVYALLSRSLFTAPVSLHHILVILEFSRGSLCWSSPQLAYCIRILECSGMFVRSCLYRTGKYRYLVACCSDAFLYAAAFSVIDFSDVFCVFQDIM